MLCVCPGSYDPVTSGHLDVIRRAATLATTVIVAVVSNPSKKTLFTPDERVQLIEQALPVASGNITVEAVPEGLLVDYCRQVGATAIVKGLRGGTDFAYEMPMALMNRHLTGIETVFLPGDPKLEHISSSLVKEVARFGGDVTGMLPDPVLAVLLDRLHGQ